MFCKQIIVARFQRNHKLTIVLHADDINAFAIIMLLLSLVAFHYYRPSRRKLGWTKIVFHSILCTIMNAINKMQEENLLQN